MEIQMNKVELYIANEFARYFPEADILVDASTETIEVIVDLDDQPDRTYTMEVGSDDNYFVFGCYSFLPITVPFAEWM
jgi:hypothetical protein